MKLNSVVGGACLAMAVYLVSGSAVALQPPASPAPSKAAADRTDVEIESAIRSFGGDKSVTRPGREAVMGFSTPTTIKEVVAKGGQTVKKGDLLVRGDDGEQVAVYKFTKLQAETTLPVDKAEASKELAELEYKKYKEIRENGVGSEQEYQRAELTWKSAVIDLDTAKLQQEQQKAALERADSMVERFRLRAPFDGQVDIVLYDEGHNVNEQDKVIRIVDISKLWMDVPVATQQTIRLGTKLGDPAWVLMEVPGGVRILNGKVVEVAPTGDSSSRTRRVRVEIPNPEGEGRVIAGEPAWVRLTEPTAEWTSKSGARNQGQ